MDKSKNEGAQFDRRGGAAGGIVSHLQPAAATSVPLLLLVSIDQRWEKYLTELKNFRKNPSGDTVRMLRVASRRLHTILQMLDELEPYKPLKRVLREHREQLNSLDELRDTQVMLRDITGELSQFPVLLKFQGKLQKKDARAMKKAKKEFKKIEPGETVRVLVRWMERLEGKEIEDMPEKLRQSIDASYQEVHGRFEQLDPTDPTTIHCVRLAFKKFRYKILVLQPLLLEYPPDALECMDKYQDWMGTIQDIQVLREALEDFGAANPQLDVQPVSQFYQQRLAEAVADYMKHKDMLNDFWRPAAGQPFPWRQANENIPAKTWNCDGA